MGRQSRYSDQLLLEDSAVSGHEGLPAASSRLLVMDEFERRFHGSHVVRNVFTRTTRIDEIALHRLHERYQRRLSRMHMADENERSL